MAEEIKTDEEIWSWSRINGFRQGIEGDGCAYGWYLTYRLGDRGVGNYFSEYGSLGHDLIERFGKNEIFIWDIEEELEKGLMNIGFKAPFTAMGKIYVNKIREFFNNGFEDRFKKYKFIKQEEEMQVNINGNKVRGFIDLIANHDDLGFIVGDWKSSKPYEGKTLENNIMQLYVYSIGIKEQFGRYPDHLLYYYFKEPKKEFPYKFSLDELDRTKDFVTETIEISKTYTKEEQFKPRCLEVPDNDFYACFLCSHRYSCTFSKLKA